MSIELTECIRNATFSCPMDSEDRKYYYEQLALNVIKYCFNDYDHLSLKDSPDLQSNDGSIGIEVTEIAIKRNKAIEGDHLQYMKTKYKKYIEKIEKNGGSVKQYCYYYSPVTMEDELDAMKNIFQKKISKIRNYRIKGFTTLGLIMIMTEPPLPSTVFEWGKTVHEINSNSQDLFDEIYFTYPSALSILNCKTGEVEFKCINPNDYDAIMRYARIQVEKK